MTARKTLLGQIATEIPENFKIVKQTDDFTTLRVLVTTNGSPTQKDLQGDFFDQNTYFGDDIVREKFAVYEHFKNATSNPFMPPTKQLLGKATFVKKDDWGRWFDFELKRSEDYHDWILALAEMKVLGASTQTWGDPGSYERTADGYIKRWIENEVSLTPTPADPKTIDQMFVVAKSLGWVPQTAMLSKTLDVVNPENGGVAEETTPAEETTDVSKSEFEIQMESALSGEEETVNDTTETENDLGTALPDDSGFTEAQKAWIKAVVKQLYVTVTADWFLNSDEANQVVSMLTQMDGNVKAIAETVTATHRNTGELKSGLLGMAEHIGKAARVEINRQAIEESMKSQTEKRVEEEIASQTQQPVKGGSMLGSKIPANAPGRNS